MTAESHRRTLVVWDVPSAIERGATFNVKVGLKCAAECEPDTWVIGIRDADGRVLASRRVGSEPWLGTALYYAEAELTAPTPRGFTPGKRSRRPSRAAAKTTADTTRRVRASTSESCRRQSAA
ncbi:MAG TPA: hypothetical protein VF329_05185 [Gammaproteobacteria bacterium]